MTVSMTEQEVIELVGAAVAGGVLLIMLMVGLFIYLLVRPPRRRREAPPPEAIDYEEMLAVMERMERRLEALERVVDTEPEPRDRILAAGEERPETRRTK